MLCHNKILIFNTTERCITNVDPPSSLGRGMAKGSSWNLGMLIQLLLFIHSSALTSNGVYLVCRERRQ